MPKNGGRKKQNKLEDGFTCGKPWEGWGERIKSRNAENNRNAGNAEKKTTKAEDISNAENSENAEYTT